MKILLRLAIFLALSIPAYAQHSVTLHWNAVTKAADGTAIPSADLKYTAYRAACMVAFANVPSSGIHPVTNPSGAFTIAEQGSSLSFSFTAGGAQPASQNISIVAGPPTPLPVTVTTDQPWLTVTSDSPTTKTNLQVSVNTAGIPAGIYTGNILITNTDGTATNSPFKIPVTLTVAGTVVNASCMSSLGPQAVGTASSTTFQDNNVLAGASYEYYVTAVCEDKASAVCLYPSESVPSNTIVATIAPSSPSGIGVVAQ